MSDAWAAGIFLHQSAVPVSVLPVKMSQPGGFLARKLAPPHLNARAALPESFCDDSVNAHAALPE